MDVKNKVVIVTGASSGIGLATAKLLSGKGAKVVLAARSVEKLRKISSNMPDSLAQKTDMTKPTDIKRMVKKVVEKYGRVDILVNNAGRGMFSAVEYIDPAKYRYILELNLVAPVIAMQEVIPLMKRQGGGAIVNISSGTSKMYIPYIAGYASTKYAINAITLTARQELEKDKIVVSVVYPYITATSFAKNTIRAKVMGTQHSQRRNDDLPEADSPEKVAVKILEVIETGKDEQYVHEWIPRK
ncbi:SDR family oxidoreductase [Patescibacteria group bacterium]|nr:SDR family oxidoreductase [Patescibacteria group bacterium]MCL5798415.1 SDR family oxidoreductase [Patescibacteria group bacterium]